MATQISQFKIDGMTCGGCVNSVKDCVNGLAGIQEVTVKLDEGQATVHFDDSQVDNDKIVNAIEEAGFDVTVID